MAQLEKQDRRLGRSPWKVSEKKWNDWRWQMRNTIRSVKQLREVLPISQDEAQGVEISNAHFRMAITPYYASLIDPGNPLDPIRFQAIPREQEVLPSANDLEDPLAEDVDSPVPGLTHRYPDRVLLLVSEICSMYCRHCTRRRSVGEKDAHITKSQLNAAIKYIAEHEEVRDIVISGGDPFTLSDERIDDLLKKLRAIPHVEIIRLGSRTPVVMPMRITTKLCRIIKKYHPVYVNTHFNHPREMTQEAREACARLVDHGIPMNNQSVLLRQINDCPHVMMQLMHQLLIARVRPYYIYQCDLSMGLGHFRTPLSRGIEIMEALRGHTSGLAVPTFVVDAPGGGGKIPVSPNYIISQTAGQIILRNYEGVMCRYIENPNLNSGCGNHQACGDPRYMVKEGPGRMMVKGGPMVIGPRPERKKRNTREKRKTRT